MLQSHSKLERLIFINIIRTNMTCKSNVDTVVIHAGVYVFTAQEIHSGKVFQYQIFN